MQHILVTGASGNLGQAVVKKFIDEGHKVTGTIIPNDPVKIEIDSSSFESVIGNLSDADATEKLIASLVEKHGRIDAAVLTVGGFAMGKIEETKTADVFKQFQLNFETAYNTARPVFLQMKKQGSGRIFLIGSKPGSDMHQGKGMVAYSLSKSLIFRLAELMNDEAKGTNVVTCVIVPSTIDTPQNRKSMPNADPAKWVKPEAIADVIHFYSQQHAAAIREPVIKVFGDS